MSDITLFSYTYKLWLIEDFKKHQIMQKLSYYKFVRKTFNKLGMIPIMQDHPEVVFDMYADTYVVTDISVLNGLEDSFFPKLLENYGVCYYYEKMRKPVKYEFDRNTLFFKEVEESVDGHKGPIFESTPEDIEQIRRQLNFLKGLLIKLTNKTESSISKNIPNDDIDR